MATVTETLLLRPVASKGTVASSVPADTSIEDIYKLVNEEVADDGATSFVPSSSAVYFKFNLPNELKIKNLTGIKYVERRNTGSGCECRYINYSSLERTSEYYLHCNTSQLAGWHTLEMDENQAVLTKGGEKTSLALEPLKELLNNGNLGIEYSTAATKEVPNISQVYLEIEYNLK